ncbi:hypothetical protein [Cryobacterium sp. TMT1-62]|uniref:hypothetical protein n=1 Tax=Cryobacterium sp. TMT1-62 TaxID=1259240 RepID=UPI001F547DDB|nr:hypothetical protein [Cryobacterium sp. TMT1-62]
MSPRVFRVAALAVPTEREKSQLYIQRYLEHFPAAGELVLFDRSWNNHAGVERVIGFCTPDQTEHFLRMTPLGALVCRAYRRQEEGSPRHHQPPPQPGAVRAVPWARRQAPPAPEAR